MLSILEKIWILAKLSKRKPVKTSRTQQVIGMSNTDPIGKFVVGIVAMNEPADVTRVATTPVFQLYK